MPARAPAGTPADSAHRHLDGKGAYLLHGSAGTTLRWRDRLLNGAGLWRRPIGIWLLCLWSLLQGGPAFIASFGSSGGLRVAVWVFFLLHVFFIAGLLIPIRIARYLLLLYAAGCIFAFSLAGWFFLFSAVAWGLRPTATLIAACIAAYLLLLAWAFFYLCHPTLKGYFEGGRPFYGPELD